MGRPKLTDEKKALIRKRLIQGQSIESIAIEAQVSKSTVKRYKKDLPSALPKQEPTGDTCSKVDYTTFLTKMEEGFAKKIKGELMLYDDETEGWVWHLTKGDLRLRTSGNWWNLIVYPDSAPDGWIDKLKATGMRIAISPLHDKDTWDHDSPEYTNPETGEVLDRGKLYKAGDRKKAHWHVIIVTDQRVGYREINGQVQSICHCPYIQKCRSLKNAYDYFLHINAPTKYQGYDKDEIQKYNNFHVEMSKYEVNVLVGEMIHIIQENNIHEWYQCVEFFMDDPEMTMVLTTKPAYFMAYVKSLHYQLYPNDVKRTEVKIVDEFSRPAESDEK